jgi:hypothetical protein
MPEGKGRGCPTSPPGNPQACAAGDKRAGGLASNPPPAYGLRSKRMMSFGGAVEFFDLVTQVISFRSFSNLWYWIVLAILWSTLSHWVLGIPQDMVQRAHHGDETSLRDLHSLAEIHCRRILGLADAMGHAVTAVAAFVVTTLAILGWVYGLEFPQALLLLLMPLLIVTALSIHTARGVVATSYEDLPRRLRRHRLWVQLIGTLCIFLTALWGMYVNLAVSRLY